MTSSSRYRSHSICVCILVADDRFAPFQDGETYHKWRAYGQSKTALILFSVELARRLGPKGLKAFSLHPGSIWRNLSRSNSDED